MRKINRREWGAAFWNQNTLTLPRIIFILALLLLLARLGIALFEYSRLAGAALAMQLNVLIEWSRQDQCWPMSIWA